MGSGRLVKDDSTAQHFSGGTATKRQAGPSSLFFKHTCASDVFSLCLQDYHIIKKTTRSLSTIQVESPWRLAKPSFISTIVLIKGHGKVRPKLAL